MFHNFDKESLFFLNDNFTEISKKIDKDIKFLNLNYLSQFLSEFQFLIYYIDLSQCNNIVYLNNQSDNYKIFSSLFPELNFYFNYEEDLKMLTENNLSFSIISNIEETKQDLDFQKIILEKYQPYASLLDFYIPTKTKKFNYLDGLLLNKLFHDDKLVFKLVVRGIGYREYDYNTIRNNYNNFINRNYKINFKNPFSRDNKTIYKDKGFYNSFQETAAIIIVRDYLEKINKENDYNNSIKILNFILDNLIENKKINLNIEVLIN